MTNFYIYLDREGKLPQLKTHRWSSLTHPYFIKYINDKPVSYHGPKQVISDDIAKECVWCFATNEFVLMDSLTQV